MTISFLGLSVSLWFVNHRQHAICDQTVYAVTAADRPAWHRVGPHEEERYLPGHR